MLDNGSNQGVTPLLVDPLHEEFDRFCALSVSGELTDAEWLVLEEHLRRCARCRQAIVHYAEVASSMIPALSEDREEFSHESEEWSLDAAENRLMARLESQHSDAVAPNDSKRLIPSSVKWILLPVAAALLTLIAYQAGVRQSISHEARVGKPPSLAPAAALPLETVPPQASAVIDNHKSRQLEQEVQSRQQQIDALSEERNHLRLALAEKAEAVDRGEAAQSQASQQLDSLRKELAEAEDKLSALQTKEAADRAVLPALQAENSALSTSLKAKDEQIAGDRELLEHDRDIRNLIGARDLYIGDVYDVAQNGSTQKSFGRVFYTKGKSLVFYAYDLDQLPGVKRASTFQAWGRRPGEQGHDINLGVFYQDEQNRTRWILKSNDATTLSQLEAVFVTVEPHAESHRPSGKPILFSNLKLAPNHP